MKAIVYLRVIVKVDPVLKAFDYVNFVDLAADNWMVPNIFHA